MFKICLATWVVALTTLVTSLAIVPMEERHVNVLYKTLFHTLGCTGFQVIGQVQTFHGIIVEDNHRYGIEVVSYLQVADYHIEAVGSQSGDTVKQRVGRYLHAG